MSKFSEKSFLDIKTKLIITLINIIIIISIDKGEYLLFSLYFIISIVIIILFKPDTRLLTKRIFIVFLYPFFISIFIPFVNEGNTIFNLDFNLFNLTITDGGVTTFFSVIIKSFLSIMLLASLVISTSERELLYGLGKIYFPKIMVSIIFLMYRYIFLIRDEFRIGQLAINSRVFQKSYRSVNRGLAFLIGKLFIRSFDRAENVYKSMESRGFDGNFYMIRKENSFKKLDVILLCIFILIPISVRIVGMVGII